MNKVRTVLYIDGGCSGNAQKDMTRRRMIALVTDALGVTLSEQHHAGGSNNIAELIALRDALVWCVAHDIHTAEIYTDSQNTVNWSKAGSKVGKDINDYARVQVLRTEVVLMMGTQVYTDLVWIPRAANLAGHVIEARYAM